MKHRSPALPPLMSLFLITVACLSLLAGCSPTTSASSPEPNTIVYRDHILTAKDGVPVSQLDPFGFFSDEQGRVQYSAGGKHALTGIDVSLYQKEIDWHAVAADGIDFAIIRLGYRGYTEGGLFTDSLFTQHIQGALEAGLNVGVYFFSQAITPEEAIQEADYVLAALEGYSLSYPVVFDWEPITPGNNARTDGLDNTILTQCAKAFCTRIREGGYTPAVYFNQDMGYLTFDLKELAEFSFWLAEYDSKPTFYYNFSLWQYSNTGTVAGIEGNVDLNLDFSPFTS